jgi:hypothetical protein
MADYAISNVPRRVVYAASGTGPYAFTFEILSQTDIAVYKASTLLTLTTDYTVTINANGTGSVTLVATAGTSNITIVGSKNIQRTTDFTTGGDLFANTLNDELDNQTIFIQQVAETAERGLKAPVTDPTDIAMTLPAKDGRKGKVLAFDSTTGNPVAGPALDSVVTVIEQSANINTVADNIADVIIVADDIADVNTVAGVAGNVTTVATNIANVNAVGADLLEPTSEINTVAVDITNVNTVGANISNVNTVAGVSANVTTVAGISANVTTVAGISANVTTVAGVAANVTTVAGIDTEVTTVAGISSDVTAVAADATDIGIVATNIASVNTAASNISDIIEVANDLNEAVSEIAVVADNIASVQTVGTNIANVNTVATDIANVNTVATNIADVIAVADEIPNLATKVSKTSDTGSAVLPKGTTAERDGTPQSGYLRYNTTTNSPEIYNGTAWGSVGGGATGAGGDTVFQENSRTVTTNYTLTSGKSASTVGPLTVNSGVTLTIPSGERLVIL